MKKIVIVLFVFFSLFIIIPNNINAQTLRDLYNELNELKAKKANQDKQKEEKKYEKIQTNKEISKTFDEIELCERRIEEARIKIEELKIEIKEKEEEIDLLMRFMQISNGGNAYLEYIFGASDFTDFIYRSAIVEQLSGYNNQLINEMYDLIEENKQLQIELTKKQSELNLLMKKLEQKLRAIEVDLNDIDEIQIDLNTQIKIQEQTIAYYENQGCEMNENLLNCTDMPYTDGFIRPLNYGRISSEYGYRKYQDSQGKWHEGTHRGIDIAGNPEGTPVYAAAPGIVSAIIRRYYCGGNMVYITHNIKGKTYTSVYMHLLEIKVKNNDVVFHNTVIGTVGGHTTDYDYGGYDTCTDGAHLHFGIGRGNYGGMVYENPRSHVNFPPKGYYFNTRYY